MRGPFRRSGLPDTRPALCLIIIIGLSVLYGAFYTLAPISIDPITPDSQHYLEFNALRTAGYPMFLALSKSVFGDVMAALPMQLWLFAVCAALLTWELARLTGMLTVALLVQCALFGNVEATQYHFQLFTESLSMSILALSIAAVSAFVRTGRMWPLVIASALIGASIAVRPSMISQVVVLAIVLLMMRGRLKARWYVLIAAAAGPLLVVGMTESAYYRAHHDGPRQGLTPLIMFGKAGMIGGPPDVAAAGAADAAIRPLVDAVQRQAQPARDLLDRAPNLPAWCHMAYVYETYFQWNLAADARRPASMQTPDDPGAALVRIGLMSIAGAPLAYAELTLRHIGCMWTLTVADRKEQADYLAFLEANRPLPFEEETRLLSKARSHVAVAPKVLSIGFAGVMTLTLLAACAGVVLAVRGRPSDPIVTVGAAALMLNGNLLLTALAGIGLGRYVIGAWPLVVVASGLTGCTMLLAAAPLFRPSNPDGSVPVKAKRRLAKKLNTMAPSEPQARARTG